MKKEVASEANMENSLSTEILKGPIIPISMKLAIPVLIGQILLLVYGVMDTLFVSMIDKSSTALISGIGLAFPVFILFMALSTGLFTGISSVVARGLGARNELVIRRATDSGLLISTITAIVMVIVLYLIGEPIINMMAGKEMSAEAISSGVTYLFYIIPGLGLMLIFQSLLGVLQGEGLAKYYGISMLLSTLINIILNPILIFSFGMGVAGSALATTISLAVSLLFVVMIFLKKKSSLPVSWNIFNGSGKVVLEIVRIGIPQVLSMASLSVTMMFLNNLFGSISENAMNAWVLVGRMDEFLLLSGYAFGNATLTLIGQNYGKQNMDRVMSAFKTNLLLGLILTAVIATFYVVFARQLFSLFTDVSQVVEYCVAQVQIIAFSFLGIVTAIIVTTSFQATGRAMPGLVLDIFRMGVLTIPLTYAIIRMFDLGTIEVFYTIAGINLLMMVFSFTWCYLYLKSTKTKAIIESAAI
ncbi:MATE family efflux transporter [Paenibacillus sp. SYP-B3998]|uniref:MATE family efflux transporter n=1 Tax=Paenibacillus sp. SYP-B3998 TaxID=2678564 RepID=A0A6G4A5B6_9BACL|nr:MATE family efflux transporter [Paenibacillus sp. SYP-B3998]NEW08999.1 MATE family efflux transporter [Paenibacillus sp. SYP-B3998]